MSDLNDESQGGSSGNGWVWQSGVLALTGLVGALGGQILGFVQIRQFDADQRVWRTQSVERETALQEVALELTARRAELEELKVEIARLTQEQKTLRDTKTAAAVDAAAEETKRTDEVAALNRTRDELTKAETDLREAKAARDAAKIQHDLLNGKRVTLEVTVGGLEMQRDELSQLIAAGDAKIGVQKGVVDDLDEKIIAKKDDLDAAERGLKRRADQQAALDGQKLGVEAELKALQDRISKMAAEEETLRKFQTAVRDTVRKLTQEKMDVDADIQELDSKRVSILKEIATNTEKLRSLKKKIAETEASKDTKVNEGPPSTPDAGNGKEQP